MEMAVAPLLHLEMNFLLQKATALPQFNDVVVEAVEALSQLAGLQPQRRTEMVGVLLLQPVKQRAQACQLAVQPHRGPPRPAKGAPHLRLDLAGENSFLDAIDFGADLVGDAIHGVGNLVDDLLQQCGHGFDAMTALQHPARGIDGAQCLVAALIKNRSVIASAGSQSPRSRRRWRGPDRKTRHRRNYRW